VDHGANINVKDNIGYTSLFDASHSGNGNIVNI